MADLSAYLDFSVQLDRTTGKIVLTDTSEYPEGVEEVSGIITATQPDEITRTGDFTSPDTTFASRTAEIELRANAEGGAQEGYYTVTFKVRVPGYDDTTLSRTFYLTYTKPTGSIAKLFDVYTPFLQLTDSTSYTQDYFSVSSTTRAWSITVGTVGTRTGAASTLDLAIATKYYDAAYSGSLTATVVYASTLYSYLTLKEEIVTLFSATADTPPTFTTMKGWVKTIWERYNSLQSCKQTTLRRQDFEYAESLLKLIQQLICDGDTNTLQEQVTALKNIYHRFVSSTYTNTNEQILPYDLSDCDCGGNGDGGGSSTSSIFPLYIQQTAFTTATFYPDTRLTGNTIRVFLNEINRYLTDAEYSVDATGLTVLLDGFDATANTYELYIFKVNGQ